MKSALKPVEVDAIQWLFENSFDVAEFITGNRPRNLYNLGDGCFIRQEVIDIDRDETQWWFVINGGENRAREGDYIIRDPDGEFSVCSPAEFEEGYDVVKDGGLVKKAIRRRRIAPAVTAEACTQ